MKIIIGSDHRGISLKTKVKKWLKAQKIEVEDIGTTSSVACDYPDFGFKVALGVAKGNFDSGILICNTGIGMSIVANKVKGIRAALCINEQMAEAARQHNNANVLVLGAAFVDEELLDKILALWINTQFEGERHQERLSKIKAWGDKLVEREVFEREVEKWKKEAKRWQSQAWRR
ncbi:MAG: ribose 5-phosphate isomerase B [Candidatus Stahlbacteria bacterium]|nr:ribose 5-phosphate isomerase B [Candidatus Stahlbacteria bacterium]